MSAYSLHEAAHRAGLAPDELERFVDAGIVSPADGQFSDGDVRRAICAQALVNAGLPVDAIARAVAQEIVSLDFLDNPEFRRFAATSGETFSEVAARTGVPLELLATIREALGSPPPAPDDYVRENELAAVPYLELALSEGFTTLSLERQVRVAGEGLRRLAETEAEVWYREIIAPRVARGLTGGEIEPASAEQLADLGDQLLIAIHHGQQATAWLGNVVRTVAGQLAQAGLHVPAESRPAICFLDISGYTRMTQERGDAAAAQLAEELARVVQRTSVAHGGKPVKWLGDGVMFYFDEPGGAVDAALEMVTALSAAGMPPAHVGVHAGDVLFNQGDYFGQTVNLAARIADFARPGEVLVSSAVVEAITGAAAGRFAEIGPVELKGVQGVVTLYVARAPT